MAKSGTVAFVGRPNAGKSTLLNRLLSEKLAIVSDKPQTTRTRIVGILSEEQGQVVFFDTPGIHKPLHRLNRQMVREATEALSDADAVCLIVDASEPGGNGDRFLLEMVGAASKPKIVVFNKIDLAKKPKLLPRMAEYGAAADFAAIVPISALDGDGCDRLMGEIWKVLPEGEPRYDPELLTIHPERFLVSERIREKVLEATHHELPFTTAVLLESWEDPGEGRALRISANILVEEERHRGMLIGKGGEKIKAIGTAARLDLEEFLERKIFLELRVRHEQDWRENPRLLADLDRDAHATATEVDFAPGEGAPENDDD